MAASRSRRRFLLGSGALGATLASAALARSAFPQRDAPADDMGAMPLGVPRAPFTAGSPLIQPEVRRSAGGELRTTLQAGYAYHEIGGYRLSLRSYEGTMPGPTLCVSPGDMLRIRLVNDLPPNPDPAPADMALPHHFNTTNFHFHGGHVSPSGIADNIFRAMEPGQGYDIEIAIPKDHPSGTYWYHPHHHGSADVQLTSGMAGAILVEGDFAEVPEIAAAEERVLILNEVLFDHRGAIESYDTVWPEAVPRFLSVNGQREPALGMRPGEVQRWRIIHAGHEDNLRLALDGHGLQAIAYDGIPLSKPQELDSLVIAPGQRADLLIQAGPAGSYTLRAVGNDQGYPSPTGPLARLIVAGAPAAMRLPGSLPAPPLAVVGDGEITGRRRLDLSSISPESPAAANYQEFAFLVCGRRFDPDRVDQRVRLGAVEEWLVTNQDSADHIFHIHTNPFEVVAVNGEPLADPVWRDTVIVPRNGSITFRTRFLDYTGRFVLHCHMMNHEELGMMQVVEVA
jgi:FtsP/CotA-like multicopper oxidase with cupredoxin domain